MTYPFLRRFLGIYEFGYKDIKALQLGRLGRQTFIRNLEKPYAAILSEKILAVVESVEA